MVQRYVEADAEIDATLANLERRLARLDPMLASRVEVARLSDDIRVEEGLRAATLARFVSSGKPFTGEERIEAAEDADAVNVTWQRLQQLAEEIGSPAISAGVERVKSEVFDQGEPVYKAVTHAAGVGSPSPMDALTWRRWTNANLPKSLAPRETAIGEISARLDQMRDEATFASTMDDSAIAALFVIMILAGFHFQNRVVSPIGALTKALDSFAEVGRGSGPTADRSENLAERFAERRDEIGSLARAVLHMRRHADELGELNARFDALIENLPQGVSFYDSADALVVANKRFGELYGFPSVESLIGKPFSEVAHMSEIIGSGQRPAPTRACAQSSPRAEATMSSIA